MASTNYLIRLFDNAFHRYWLPPLTTLIMDTGASFFKFSAPFSHTSVTYKLVAIHFTHLIMNFYSKWITAHTSHLVGTLVLFHMFTCLLLNWLKEVYLVTHVLWEIHCAFISVSHVDFIWWFLGRWKNITLILHKCRTRNSALQNWESLQYNT